MNRFEQMAQRMKDQIQNQPKCDKHPDYRIINGWCEQCEKEQLEAADIKKTRDNINDYLKLAGVPMQFIGKEFTIKGLSLPSQFTGQIQDYIGAMQNDPNLMLTGGTGSGKTTIACAILKEYMYAGNRDCEFVTVPDLLLEIRSTFQKDSTVHEKDVIDRYTKADLLVLDDLGSEKVSEFALQSFYLILDRRIRDMKGTIVTTNLTIAEVKENYGARIASRLGAFRSFKLGSKDWRKVKR